MNKGPRQPSIREPLPGRKMDARLALARIHLRSMSKDTNPQRAAACGIVWVVGDRVQHYRKSAWTVGKLPPPSNDRKCEDPRNQAEGNPDRVSSWKTYGVDRVDGALSIARAAMTGGSCGERQEGGNYCTGEANDYSPHEAAIPGPDS
jgi:hypothetical protein